MNFMGLFWTHVSVELKPWWPLKKRGWMFIDLLTTVVDRIVTIAISCQCSTAFCALFELWCFTMLISFPSSISLILDKLSCCFCRGRGGTHGALASFQERFLERCFFCLDIIVSDWATWFMNCKFFFFFFSKLISIIDKVHTYTRTCI